MTELLDKMTLDQPAIISPVKVDKHHIDIKQLLEKGNPGHMKIVHIYFHRLNYLGVPYSEVDAVTVSKHGQVFAAYYHSYEEPKKLTGRYLGFDPRGQTLSEYIMAMLRHKDRSNKIIKIVVVLDGFGEVVIDP